MRNLPRTSIIIALTLLLMGSLAWACPEGCSCTDAGISCVAPDSPEKEKEQAANNGSACVVNFEACAKKLCPDNSSECPICTDRIQNCLLRKDDNAAYSTALQPDKSATSGPGGSRVVNGSMPGM